MEYFEKEKKNFKFLLLTFDNSNVLLNFRNFIKLILLTEIFIDTPSFGESSDHIYIYLYINRYINNSNIIY